jgi:hypothetical protein
MCTPIISVNLPNITLQLAEEARAAEDERIRLLRIKQEEELKERKSREEAERIQEAEALAAAVALGLDNNEDVAAERAAVEKQEKQKEAIEAVKSAVGLALLHCSFDTYVEFTTI